MSNTKSKKCAVCRRLFLKPSRNFTERRWRKKRFCSFYCYTDYIVNKRKKDNDITGKRFGRLIAIKRVGKQGRAVVWLFRCDCGGETKRIGSQIINGGGKSCGCLQREVISKQRGRLNPTFIHGMTGTRFYRIYAGIRSRCFNKNRPHYQRWGARGIICLWGSFMDFKKDMYRGYLQHVKNFGEKQTQIDRINNDGNYCKDNCRWATLSEQAQNKRKYKLNKNV